MSSARGSDQRPAARKFEALKDPVVLQRIREAEGRVRAGEVDDGQVVSASQLGDMIDELKARGGQGTLQLEDPAS